MSASGHLVQVLETYTGATLEIVAVEGTISRAEAARKAGLGIRLRLRAGPYRHITHMRALTLRVYEADSDLAAEVTERWLRANAPSPVPPPTTGDDLRP